jgi:hypothetical protein
MEAWQDRLEIREVLDRYAAGIDCRDWDLVRRCFTADCTADYGRSGQWTDRESFVTALDEMHRDVGPTLHRITNHRIEVDADRATATSYFDALLQVEHRSHDLLHVIGTYTDDLVRNEDDWQITTRRTDTLLWRREHSATT